MKDSSRVERDNLTSTENFYELQAEHLAVIHSYASVLASNSNIQELLWYVVEQVIPSLGFEDCVIYLLDQEKQLLYQRALWNKSRSKSERTLSDFHLEIGEGITGASAAAGKVINIADTRIDNRYKVDTGTNLSECSIPILYDNKVIGVLDSESTQANFYTPEREQLLITVTSLLSASVGKSISMDKVKQTIEQLKSADKRQKALYEISGLFHKANNMDEFYAHLHSIVSTLMYTGNFGIVLYDKKQQRIEIPYFIDTVDEPPDTIVSADALKETLTFYCLTQNKSFFLSRKDINELDITHGFKRVGTTPNAWLGEPFVVDKDTTGIIIVQSYLDEISYTQEDSELLKFVSEHLNTTLQNVRAQEKIQHQALHDGLTGLANRTLFKDRLQHRMKTRKRKNKGMFAILFLDLDHFKIINDCAGHHIGDEVLVKVSDSLSRCVRLNDTVARFGGDEFAIILDTIEAQSEAIDAANRIIEAVEKNMLIENKNYSVSVSIGIRCCTDEVDMGDLIKHADLAMYQAKKSGRGCYSIYLKDQIIIEQTRKTINKELKQAIAVDQFEVYYQPIVKLEDYQILGVEALVRWRHPNGELLLPDDFIDIAEESGVIKQIDLLVMDKALLQIKKWISDEPLMKDLSVNVNLSAIHFTTGDIVAKIKKLLKKHQLKGTQLKIEITETAMIQSIDLMTDLIKQIQNLGIEILLDDFGTGYSSLSYLHQLCIDTIKIDQSFISNMPRNSNDNPIINSIVAMSDAMSMKVVAEGIEEPYQVENLKSMGCQFGQGFLFSKPLMAKDLQQKFLAGINLNTG